MTRYRVTKREDGWIVEILDGLPVDLDGKRISTPQWTKASEPFATREEAESEIERLRGGT